MTGLPTLAARRLRLRPLHASDAAAVTELLDDPQVSATLEGIPHPYRLEYAQAWIQELPSLFESRDEIHLAIELREGPELIGAIALLTRDADAPRHLGYWLGRRHWGFGYATEAVAELVRYAREGLDLDAVAARCMVDNPASVAVLGKAGLRRVGPSAPIEKSGAQHAVDAFLLEFSAVS